MTDKRPLSPPPPPSESDNELAIPSKRPRTTATTTTTTTSSTALVPMGTAAAQGRSYGRGGVPRTSSLAAPTMRLTGHVGEVFAAAFSSAGSPPSSGDVTLLASGGLDRSILLWRASGECDNVACLQGHKSAVLSLSWLGGGPPSAAATVVSGSADGTARAWDVERERQVKKATEHGTSVVNCVSAAGGGGNAPPLFVTASDDGTARVWDMRVKRSVATLGESVEEEEEEGEQEDGDDDGTDQRERRRRRLRKNRSKSGFPLLACAISPSAESAYTSGIDGVVRAWDLRKTSTAALALAGHSDTVTSLALRPTSTSSNSAAPTHLLSNSADGTLRSWDVRPFAPSERCSRAYVGASHSLERNLLRCCWSGADAATGESARWVAAGSSDGVAYVWDAKTAKLEYALPGHSGSVNDVCFHPTEPVIASASSDGSLFVGELAS